MKNNGWRKVEFHERKTREKANKKSQHCYLHSHIWLGIGIRDLFMVFGRRKKNWDLYWDEKVIKIS